MSLCGNLNLYKAGIAQLVEQWIENPRVTSSNLVPGTFHAAYSLLFNTFIYSLLTQVGFEPTTLGL